MKPSEELRQLREQVATLNEQVATLGRDNPRGNPRNRKASPEVSLAAAPALAQAFPKKPVNLDSRDVGRLLRDLEEVNSFLDQGDAEAAQDELDEIIAGIEDSGDNGDD